MPESLVGMSFEQFGNLYRSQVSKLAVTLGTLPLHKSDRCAPPGDNLYNAEHMSKSQAPSTALEFV